MMKDEPQTMAVSQKSFISQVSPTTVMEHGDEF